MITIYLGIVGVKKVTLTKRRRSRRLTISGDGQGELRVSLPMWLSYEKAEALLRKKTAWIKRYLEKIENLGFRHLVLPKRDVSMTDHDMRERIMARADEISRKIGAAYNKMRVKELKTKWGSCSSSNCISLNIKILRLPEELMDYVITHELVHTRVKNHGPDFWLGLTEVLPEAIILDGKLKGYSPIFL